MFIKLKHLYLAWNAQFSSFTHSDISNKIAGPLGSPTEKIKMFSRSSKQRLVGIQALVSQSVYIIFRCEIHRHDIFGCKGHIFRQVVITFVLFEKWNEGESLPRKTEAYKILFSNAVINSKQNNYQTIIATITNH